MAAYPLASKLAHENTNLSVLARDGAIIRCQAAPWVAHPATDLAAIKGAFEVVEEEKGEETEKPYPCLLTIGDFKVLGQFLDEFTARGLLVNADGPI